MKTINISKINIILFMIIFFFSSSFFIYSDDYAWDGEGDGTSWNDKDNWWNITTGFNPDGVPSGDDRATIGTATIQNANVQLDTSVGIGELRIRRNSTLTIILANTLTISNTASWNGSLSLGIFFGGWGTLILNGQTLTVEGNITFNNNNGILNASAFGADIDIGGNWDNTAGGTFNSGINTVTFNGSSAQNFTPGTSTYYDITVDKTAGRVQVQDDVTQNTNGVLSMQNGDIELNGNTWTLGASLTINDADSPVFYVDEGILTDGGNGYSVTVGQGRLDALGNSSITPWVILP